MAEPRLTASILAIGTELTSGQITNRNAAWIAQKLEALGVETVLHETVADDRPAIRAALDHCSHSAPLLFVTGGLGPTTDDFTREVIAEWLGRPLELDEPTWAAIHARLSAFTTQVAETNRRQAYFPRGTEILPNAAGTAPGFMARLESGGRVWVLPGPPREVAAIWESGVEPELRRALPGLQPTRLLTWQCAGKPEAELGELTEKTLQGSGLKTGYRAHRPYVEIKVWCPEAEIETKADWLGRLDQSLAPWLISKNGEDVARLFVESCVGRTEALIHDALTGGILGERVGKVLRDGGPEALRASCITDWEARPLDAEARVRELLFASSGAELTLAAAGIDRDGRFSFGLRLKGAEPRVRTLPSPWRIPAEAPADQRRYREELVRAAAAEHCLKGWREWLSSSG